MAEIVALEPKDELVFNAENGSMVTLKMTNLLDQEVQFKLKTTAPKQYFVRPNSGALPPRGTVEAKIVLQSNLENEDRSKHKFMVQFIPVPADFDASGLEDMWLKAKQDDITKFKLKCVFMRPEPEIVKVKDECTTEEFNKLSEEIKRLREVETTLRKEQAEMRQQIDRMSQNVVQGQSDSQIQVYVAIALVVAVLAFLFGKFS